VGDYAHGVAHVWSSDGHLMATASQTAVMRAFDPAAAPWAPATPSS
jgi:acyl-CoA thioesterase